MRLILLSFFFFSQFSYAQNEKLDIIILSKKTIRNIVKDYPQIGSDEHNADFEILHRYQTSRTEIDCENARHDEKLSVKQLYKGILTSAQINIATIALADVYATVGANAYLAKSIFKRPRPYDFDGSLSPCISKEKSWAYPSGHTMTARLTARILSAYYPEKEKLLIERADEFSKHRVLGGVHHPSDVTAGKKLADHLASLMLSRLHQ